MTAICPGGGSSSANTGSVAVATYGAGLIADLLVLFESPWLIPVIPLLGLTPLTLATFCGTDPPAIPTFTSAETNAILNVQLGADFDSGIAKARDTVLNFLWAQNCHCDSGTATAPTPPTIPTGTPIFQAPAPPNGQPCFSYDFVTGIAVSSGFTQIFNAGDGFGDPNVTVHPPLNVTSVHYDVTLNAHTGTGIAKHFIVNWEGPYPSTSVLRTDTFVIAPLAEVHVTIIPPSGAYYQRAQMFYTSGSGSETYTFHTDEYCNGATPGAQQSCCPPDASTQAYLDLILKTVTLIQRQNVPFAYVSGPAHAGLSDTGVISVSGTIGLLVELTTVPTQLGTEFGEPTRLFDAGYVNLGTADGYSHSIRLQSDHQLVLPNNAGLVTTVGYSLHSGVVATITELLREP